MAYIADFLTISSATKVSSIAITADMFPEHVADDYLVIGVTTEAEATTTHSCSGWTQIGATVGSGTTGVGLYSSMWYKKCAGSAETGTPSWSVSNAAHIHVWLIKDADTTTFLDGTPSAAYVATASQFSSASITTSNADALLLFYIGVDSTTTTPTMCHSAPGPVHFIDSSDNGGANVTAGSKVMAGGCSGWYMQRAAGATPTPSWNASLTASTTRFTVGIKNKSGGQIPAYIDDSETIGTKLMDGHFWVSATTRNNENFKATPLTVTSIITHLGTLTGTFDSGASVVDTHINPYSATVSSTPAASASALTGFELGFPTTLIDMTTGWIVGALMMSGPKLANFNHGTIKQGGTFLSIGKTTNYRIFQIIARDNLVNTEGRAVFSVQANQTQTQSGQSASAPTIASIDKICILNRGNTATLALYCCDFHLIQKIIAAGGDSVNPVDAEGLYQIGKFLRLKLIQRLGATGLMPMVPLQIGGGDAVYCKLTAGSMQFPRIYSRTAREINYHGADNAIGLSLYGKSGDTIYIGDGYVISSPSPAYFEINASATSAATWYLKGLTLSGLNVTLRNVMTFDSIAFSGCLSLVFSGCTIQNSQITGVPATNDSLTTNASTNIDYCTIDVSLVTAGNRWCSVADPSIFSYNTFTGGGGHAIRITTPGTYAFVGNVFTGFGADGSTGAAILNDSGGAVTINVSGGGSTPTVKNETSASTTVNNNVTLTIAAPVSLVGAEIRIYDMDNNPAGSLGTELAGSESYGSATYPFSGAVGNTIWIQIMLAGYEEFGQQTTMPASSGDFTALLKADTNA